MSNESDQSQERPSDVAPSSFASHAAGDTALQPPQYGDAEKSRDQGLTSFGRLALFFCFPFLVGIMGLYVSYLRSLNDPSQKISIDDDFVYPFLVALTVVLVVGFRTGGFTNKQPKPIIVWPKVRRKKKVVIQRVIVDDDELEKKND